MKIAYQCERCGQTHQLREWIFPCLWCGNETCETCMASHATCKPCALGKTEKELEAKFELERG